jgi:hypothetical protein|tara:strand:+ start:34 stop:234 length:201 start_codon:yes stop_codon:yes gene_type:complete
VEEVVLEALEVVVTPPARRRRKVMMVVALHTVAIAEDLVVEGVLVRLEQPAQQLPAVMAVMAQRLQ